MAYIVLGLDPASFKNMGYCVAQKSDSIQEIQILERNTFVFSVDKTTKDKRFIEVKQKVYDMIHKHKVNCVSFERTQFGKPFVMSQIYETIGVIKLICQENGVDLKEISPMTAKKAITGSGKAKKKDVMNSIKEKFKLEKKDLSSDHEADAVAMAYVCLLDREKKDGP